MLPVIACAYCYEWHLIMLIYMLIYALSGSLSQFVWYTQLSFLHLMILHLMILHFIILFQVFPHPSGTLYLLTFDCARAFPYLSAT